jgi:hypothetical protein
MKLSGNGTAHHALGELETGTAFQRLNLHHAYRVHGRARRECLTSRPCAVM